ncbi:hypothetical protein FH972_011865 [Carpinus fangiana]|uniref:Glyoxalase-like domain-containing protein n=1 Tax=Carpinus fangiana TaxID=176857 RepID=A0A5N6R504_9ROSI|nr:hypothetical protein FH972_011865 [Carpinus fangiana]
MHPKRKAEQELPQVLPAPLKFGGSTILVSDDCVDDSATPAKIEWTGITLCLETENVEAAIAKAVKAGAVAVGEIEDGEGACWGGRVRKIGDALKPCFILVSFVRLLHLPVRSATLSLRPNILHFPTSRSVGSALVHRWVLEFYFPGSSHVSLPSLQATQLLNASSCSAIILLLVLARVHLALRGIESMSTSLSNKRSKTLTPDVEDVGGDHDFDNYTSWTAKKAEGGDAALQSFQECMVHLNGYHDFGKIDDGVYLRAMSSFQTETWSKTAFLIVVQRCWLTWLTNNFGGGPGHGALATDFPVSSHHRLLMKPLDGGHRTVQNSQEDTVVENLEKTPSLESILERSMVGMRWGPGRESGLRSKRTLGR